MLRQITTISLRSSQISLAKRLTSTSTAPVEKWDLYAGILVERLPVVTKTLNPLERKFQEQLWRIEFEKSLKSDHEQRHERDLVQAELIKKGKMEIDLDDSASQQTAQDLLDAYTEELKKFALASRTTDDDRSNNTSSTDRCLEDTLYLLLEQKLGNQSHLLLPQGERKDGETMRQAAERVLREKCGSEMQVHFYGNAPCGFYKYKYPRAMRNDSRIGAKIFFYRAALKQGNVSKDVGSKFEWLANAGLEGKFKNANYAESIQKFLI